MRRYVGIEGSSYVGKTTVAQELAFIGHAIIPEYDAFGPFPVSDGSVAGLKGVVNVLLERERARSRLVPQKGICFADRTPISLLTFDEMMAEFNSDDGGEARHEVVAYTVERISDMASSEDIILPDMIAVLRLTSQAEFKQRVIKRGITAVGALAVFEMQRYVSERARQHALDMVGANNTRVFDVDDVRPSQLARALVSFARRDI